MEGNLKDLQKHLDEIIPEEVIDDSDIPLMPNILGEQEFEFDDLIQKED